MLKRTGDMASRLGVATLVAGASAFLFAAYAQRSEEAGKAIHADFFRILPDLQHDLSDKTRIAQAASAPLHLSKRGRDYLWTAEIRKNDAGPCVDVKVVPTRTTKSFPNVNIASAINMHNLALRNQAHGVVCKRPHGDYKVSFEPLAPLR